MQVQDSDDLGWLTIRKRLIPAGRKRSSKCWELIEGEYYKRFGKTKELTAHLMRMKRAIILRAEIAEQFDQALEWDLQKLEKEIESYGKQKGETSDFATSNAVLSKFVGYQLNPHKTSVAEWYGARALMEKTQEQLKKQHEAQKNKKNVV